ncbi:MAG: VIT domain-containing protein [Planctomycetota bacterium]
MSIRNLVFTLVTGLALAVGAAAQGLGDLHLHEEGGRRVRPPRGVPGVTIEKHVVDVTIEGGAATTRVTQVFRNPHRLILEGTYLFPVPEDASLTDFSMEMNGKMVKGEVLERDKARQIYEDIVRRTRDPGLLEYAGRKLFRARVFPVPAGGTVEVQLAYVERLERDSGVLEYRYPLKTQAFDPGRVAVASVRVAIKSRQALKSVFSSSHPIDRTDREGETVVGFEGKQVMADRDFQLYFAPSDGDLGFALLTDKPADKDGFFMVNIAPSNEVAKEEILPKDVIFVVDTSGSMREDDKMEQARKALTYGLKGLNPGDRFNVVSFSTEARAMKPGLVAVDDASVGAAVAWVAELEAKGGTNIKDALEQGLARFESADRVAILVFLTDGLPTVGDTDVASIRKHAKTRNGGKARVFTYGVGYDVNTTLLDALGEENGGVSDYVTPSQNIELVLGSFFDKIAYPVMSDLELVVDGIELLEVYPKKLPDLFRGGELTVFGRYRGAGTKAIRLKGKLGGREREHVFEGRFADGPTKRDFVRVLWAKRKVGYLWDEIQANGFQAELRDEIVRLGKTYAIATPYTSFLVLEDEPQAGGAVRGNGPVGRTREGRRGTPVPPGAPAKRGDRDFAGGPGSLGVGGGAGGGGALDHRGAPGRTGGVKAPSEASSNSGEQGVRRALERKKLKEASLDAEVEEAKEELDRSADARDKDARVRVIRFEGKTFERRDEVWVEAGVDALDEAKRKQVEEVEAFSKRYFELLAAHPELGRILARFESVMIVLDGKVVRFKAAPAEEATPDPTKDPEPKKEAGSKG